MSRGTRPLEQSWKTSLHTFTMPGPGEPSSPAHPSCRRRACWTSLGDLRNEPFHKPFSWQLVSAQLTIPIFFTNSVSVPDNPTPLMALGLSTESLCQRHPTPAQCPQDGSTRPSHCASPFAPRCCHSSVTLSTTTPKANCQNPFPVMTAAP